MNIFRSSRQAAQRESASAEQPHGKGPVTARAPAQPGICDGCFELAWRPSSVISHEALVPIDEKPLPAVGVDVEAQRFVCESCGSHWSWTLASGWEAAANHRKQ